jgi:hypothetical protein
VAAVAAGLDAGDGGVPLGLGHGQLEVLDLVPGVCVGLGHHGLFPLAEDVRVAGRPAEFRRLVVVVLAGAEGGLARLGGLGHGQAQEENQDDNKSERENRLPHRDLLSILWDYSFYQRASRAVTPKFAPTRRKKGRGIVPLGLLTLGRRRAGKEPFSN